MKNWIAGLLLHRKLSLKKQTVIDWLSFAVYIVVGLFSFKALEEAWTHVDCLYFLCATMTTVGYGDLSPTHTGSHLFTIVAILMGIVFVFPLLGNELIYFISPITAKGREIMELLFPQTKVDLDGDGATEYTIPRHWAVYYPKNIIPSLMLNICVQLVCAGIFCALESNNPEVTWTYSLSLYHCFVTATTVGYGDVYISTQGARVFSCFHMLSAVVLLAEMLSTLSELQDVRKDTLKRIGRLQQRLKPDLYDALLQCAKDMRPEVKRDGKGLTELEYVLAMAVTLDMIKWKELYPYVKQFRQLDLDHTGRLSEENVRQAMQPTDAQRGVMKSVQSGGELTMEMESMQSGGELTIEMDHLGIHLNHLGTSGAVPPSDVAAASASSLAEPSPDHSRVESA